MKKPVRPGPWDPSGDDDADGMQRLRRRAVRQHVPQRIEQLPTAWAGGQCPATDKRRYATRAAARAANREFGVKGLSVYDCPACGGAHLGHLPVAVKRGTASRDEIYRPTGVRPVV